MSGKRLLYFLDHLLKKTECPENFHMHRGLSECHRESQQHNSSPLRHDGYKIDKEINSMPPVASLDNDEFSDSPILDKKRKNALRGAKKETYERYADMIFYALRNLQNSAFARRNEVEYISNHVLSFEKKTGFNLSEVRKELEEAVKLWKMGYYVRGNESFRNAMLILKEFIKRYSSL